MNVGAGAQVLRHGGLAQPHPQRPPVPALGWLPGPVDNNTNRTDRTSRLMNDHGKKAAAAEALRDGRRSTDLPGPIVNAATTETIRQDGRSLAELLGSSRAGSGAGPTNLLTPKQAAAAGLRGADPDQPVPHWLSDQPGSQPVPNWWEVPD
jgi:hypothetical protein